MRGFEAGIYRQAFCLEPYSFRHGINSFAQNFRYDPAKSEQWTQENHEDADDIPEHGALFKLFFLAIDDISKRWTMWIHEQAMIYS
jgi:hypothetical protein